MPAIFHVKIEDESFDGAVNHIVEASDDDTVWHCEEAGDNFDGAIFHVKWAEDGHEEPVWRVSGISRGTVTTVGPAVSPLSLTDAIANSLSYVKAFGGTELTGTPTPDAPATITCNNGILKVKDSELPVGYKRLTGITYDSNTYYETNEKLYGSDTLTIRLSNTKTSGQNVIGAYSGTGDDALNFSLYIYGAGSTSNSYLRHGTKSTRPRYGTGTRTLVIGPSGTDGFLTDVTYDAEDFETTSTFRIGTLPNSTSAKYDGNIVGNITVSNRLKYIPCERVSDGEIGYYETFTGTFLEPKGSGTPVSMGYDVSYMTEIYADGTVETINANRDFLSRDGETVGKIINSDGIVSDNSNYTISAPFTLPAGDYTCTWTTGAGGSRPFSVFKCDANGNIILTADGGKVFYQGTSVIGVNTGNFTLDSTTLVRSSYRNNMTDLAIFSTSGTATAEMLLKIGDYADVQEILSGAITRNVGIQILDGTEDWEKPAGSDYFRLDRMFADAIPYDSDNPAIICSHFVGRQSKTSAVGMNDKEIKLGYTSIYNRLYLKYYDMTTADDLKQWLAEQYAAGTPVIVVYPLATATTESVTGQTLQVTDGDNTLEITQASIDGLELEAKYMKGVVASAQEVEPQGLDNNVSVSLS